MFFLLKLIITALVSAAAFIYFRKDEDGCPMCLALNAAIAAALLTLYILNRYLG